MDAFKVARSRLSSRYSELTALALVGSGVVVDTDTPMSRALRAYLHKRERLG